MPSHPSDSARKISSLIHSTRRAGRSPAPTPIPVHPLPGVPEGPVPLRPPLPETPRRGPPAGAHPIPRIGDSRSLLGLVRLEVEFGGEPLLISQLPQGRGVEATEQAADRWG